MGKRKKKDLLGSTNQKPKQQKVEIKRRRKRAIEKAKKGRNKNNTYRFSGTSVRIGRKKKRQGYFPVGERKTRSDKGVKRGPREKKPKYYIDEETGEVIYYQQPKGKKAKRKSKSKTTTEAKKPRKTRSDKGVKRGPRNKQKDIGSISISNLIDMISAGGEWTNTGRKPADERLINELREALEDYRKATNSGELVYLIEDIANDIFDKQTIRYHVNSGIQRALAVVYTHLYEATGDEYYGDRASELNEAEETLENYDTVNYG